MSFCSHSTSVPLRCHSCFAPVLLRFRSSSAPVPLRFCSCSAPVSPRFRSDSFPVPLLFHSGSAPVLLRFRFDSAIVRLRFRSSSAPVLLRFRSGSAPVPLQFRSGLVLYMRKDYFAQLYFPKLRSVDVNDYNGVVFGCHWETRVSGRMDGSTRIVVVVMLDRIAEMTYCSISVKRSFISL